MLISLVRLIKYYESIIILYQNGYGEPANCILRSVFEGILWMRWSLINEENASLYFNSGKNEMIKIAQKLTAKGLTCFEGSTEQEEIRGKLKKELEKYSFKNWSKMAEAVGLYNVYLNVYPMLSAMAHGNFLFLGERIETKKISFEPDNFNILPFLGLACMFYRDAFNLTNEFIKNKKIFPLDEYGLFLTLGK